MRASTNGCDEDPTGTLADAGHATGEQKANQNREDELPA